MADAPHLTVRALRAVGVELPTTYVLGTSRGAIAKVPLLLIDLETEEDVTGRAWLFCYLPAVVPAIAKILEEVERVVKGDRVAPLDLWSKLSQRFALIGVQGIVRMAMAGSTWPPGMRWHSPPACRSRPSWAARRGGSRLTIPAASG